MHQKQTRIQTSIKHRRAAIAAALLIFIFFCSWCDGPHGWRTAWCQTRSCLLFIVKGLIILVACAIDMRKYLVKK